MFDSLSFCIWAGWTRSHTPYALYIWQFLNLQCIYPRKRLVLWCRIDMFSKKRTFSVRSEYPLIIPFYAQTNVFAAGNCVTSLHSCIPTLVPRLGFWVTVLVYLLSMVERLGIWSDDMKIYSNTWTKSFGLDPHVTIDRYFITMVYGLGFLSPSVLCNWLLSIGTWFRLRFCWTIFCSFILCSKVDLRGHVTFIQRRINVDATSCQWAHAVYTTSPQCRCNVMMLLRRWGDVE